MNPLESELQYPFGDALPAHGEAIEVAPGILWARMGLPFALDHINVWMLEDEADDGRRGWTIVDCGIDRPATRDDWQRLFAGAMRGEPVLRVVVTHMHPDHIGLAHWLTERFAARLWISGTDFNVARNAWAADAGIGGPESARFMARHGLDDAESMAGVEDRSGYFRDLVPKVPTSYRRLIDGQVLVTGRDGTSPGRRSWTLHAGYGHAPEHMSLHDAGNGVLISGDMVLPRISTNISVVDVEPEANPLRLYLDSLARLRERIGDDALVLPSHGRPFRGLHTRIGQLESHHADRLAETVAACSASPQTARQIVPVLFKRPLDLHQMTFALGEALAHLHLLWHDGRLRRIDDGGTWRFAGA